MSGEVNSRDVEATVRAPMPNGTVGVSCPIDDTSVGKGVQYSVEESPPWHMSVLLGFQVLYHHSKVFMW